MMTNPRTLLAAILLLTWPVDIAKADNDPRRPAAVTAENVPVVDDETAESLRQYLETRSAAFQGWSPDGKGMLIATRFGNAAQLHRVYEPGGRREQITFFNEPVNGRFVEHADDGAILLSMGQGGNENFQVYGLDRQQFRHVLLTDGKSRNELGPVRHDGQQVLVHSNQRNGRDTDLFVCDCRKPGSMQMVLETNGQYWRAADWSQDGRNVLMLRYVSATESYPATLGMADKQLHAWPAQGAGPVSYGAMAFSPDGKNAYVACDAQGEFQQLARVDLATLEHHWLTTDLPWDIEAIEVDDTSGRVAFVANEDGASRLYLLEGEAYRRLETPVGVIDGLEFSPDGSQLGFTLARPATAADAYSLRLADGDLVRWTFSEMGGLNPAVLVEPELVRFGSFDGRSVGAYVFRPKERAEGEKFPVLIDIHGGPEGQYRPLYSGFTQHAAGPMRIAVVAPNVRGSAGYGKTYLKLDNAERREDSVKDIGALLDWIATQNDLDPERVAVTGGSYGGYMVLASLVHFGERIRAGIDIVGIANFITFLERTSPYRQDLRRAEYGDERDPAMRAVFEQINPANHAAKIRSALFVAHGKNDPRVPFSEAEQIGNEVRRQGRSVWTVYADNEGHGFAKKDNRDYLTAAMAIFLREHLKGSAGK